MCRCDGTELMPCTCSCETMSELDCCVHNPKRPTPHVHAELIKAWADGANIEYFSIPEQKWKDVTNPTWYPNFQYRIKLEPKKIVYRLCLWASGTIYLCLSKDNESEWEKLSGFKRWVTPWQHYIEEEA